MILNLQSLFAKKKQKERKNNVKNDNVVVNNPHSEMYWLFELGQFTSLHLVSTSTKLE